MHPYIPPVTAQNAWGCSSHPLSKFMPKTPARRNPGFGEEQESKWEPATVPGERRSQTVCIYTHNYVVPSVTCAARQAMGTKGQSIVTCSLFSWLAIGKNYSVVQYDWSRVLWSMKYDFEYYSWKKKQDLQLYLSIPSICQVTTPDEPNRATPRSFSWCISRHTGLRTKPYRFSFAI